MSIITRGLGAFSALITQGLNAIAAAATGSGRTRKGIDDEEEFPTVIVTLNGWILLNIKKDKPYYLLLE